MVDVAGALPPFAAPAGVGGVLIIAYVLAEYYYDDDTHSLLLREI